MSWCILHKRMPVDVRCNKQQELKRPTDDQEEKGEYRRWCVRWSQRSAAGPGRAAHRWTERPVAAAGMGFAEPAGSVGPGIEAVDGSDASAAAVPAAAASPESNTLRLVLQILWSTGVFHDINRLLGEEQQHCCQRFYYSCEAAAP